MSAIASTSSSIRNSVFRPIVVGGLIIGTADTLCDYNSETTPRRNLVSRAKEEDLCLTIRTVSM